MPLHPTLALAGVIAISISVAACGGGGGGPEIAALPSPPPPPPPPPPAPPSSVTTIAPAAATAPAAPALPQALAAGPTMAAPGSTVFPLVQTVIISDPASNRPDLATMSAGATFTIDPAASKATLDIVNGAPQVSNAALIRQPTTVYYETSGSTIIRLYVAALDWTAFGSWDAYPGGVTTTQYHSNFVTGFQTPGSAVPTSGSATYSGTTFGYVYFAGSSGVANTLLGDVSLAANFADQTISGALTNMVAGDPWYTGAYPWNSVSLSASFSGGQSRFTGTAAATTAPGNPFSLNAGATGTVVGSFFGPHAEEVGAVWTLSDGVGSAAGSIGAKRAP